MSSNKEVKTNKHTISCHGIFSLLDNLGTLRECFLVCLLATSPLPLFSQFLISSHVQLSKTRRVRTCITTAQIWVKDGSVA